MSEKKERTKTAAQAALDKVKERKMIWRKQREIAEAKRAKAKAEAENNQADNGDVNEHNYEDKLRRQGLMKEGEDDHNPYVNSNVPEKPQEYGENEAEQKEADRKPAMLESINPFMPNTQAPVCASTEEKQMNCYGDMNMIKRLQGKSLSGRKVIGGNEADCNVISAKPEVYKPQNHLKPASLSGNASMFQKFNNDHTEGEAKDIEEKEVVSTKLPEPEQIKSSSDFYKVKGLGDEKRNEKFHKLMGMHRMKPDEGPKKDGPTRTTYDPNQVSQALTRQFDTARGFRGFMS